MGTLDHTTFDCAQEEHHHRIVEGKRKRLPLAMRIMAFKEKEEWRQTGRTMIHVMNVSMDTQEI